MALFTASEHDEISMAPWHISHLFIWFQLDSM